MITASEKGSISEQWPQWLCHVIQSIFYPSHGESKLHWEMRHRCHNSVQIKYRQSKRDKNQRYILGPVKQE